MSSNRQFIVLGGGPAGLTAGYKLIKSGYKPLVFEKDKMVGGISRTENYKGFYFDMGGHRFFTKSEEVNEMWQEVLSEDFLKRPRLSRIFYKQKYFDYPLKPANVLMSLGIWESFLVGLSYVRWQIAPYKEENTFEEWVTNRFGKRLFMTFFKTYTEKVWGISCSELKAEWAAQRIKDLSVKTAVLNMFIKSKDTIKTLIEEFDYPRRGPGMMWQRVQDHIDDVGGSVELNSELVQINRNQNKIDSVTIKNFDDTKVVDGSDFISSVPVTELVQRMSPPPPDEILEASRNLKYRDFLTVCLIINEPDLFPDNWIYIHDPSVKVGRIQNFKNWSPEMVPDQVQSSLGLEYFCNVGDDLWNMPNEDLIELAKKEIVRLGMVKDGSVVDGCVCRVPKAYPVYDSEYGKHLDLIKNWLDDFENLQTIGRNGLHRYNNQDHAMLTGMYAVENALHDAQKDLWSVNADKEYHEEVKEKEGPGRNKRYIEVVTKRGLAEVLKRLDHVAFGAGFGAVCSIILAVMTAILVVKGGDTVGPTLSLLANFLPGYEVTVRGCFIGAAYGAVFGFVGGSLFAWLRNVGLFLYFSILRRRSERGFVRDFFNYM